MTLIQEIISQRLFDEDQRYRTSMLKSEWFYRQCRILLMAFMVVSVINQILLITILGTQKAYFSICVLFILLLPTIQTILVLFNGGKNSANLISIPTIKISFFTQVIIGIFFSIFMLVNIEGLVPLLHRPWLTGIDATDFLIQKYVAFPVLSQDDVLSWLPFEDVQFLQKISLDENLWLRVSFIKIQFTSLIFLSFFCSIFSAAVIVLKKKSPLISSKIAHAPVGKAPIQALRSSSIFPKSNLIQQQLANNGYKSIPSPPPVQLSPIEPGTTFPNLQPSPLSTGPRSDQMSTTVPEGYVDVKI